MVQFEGVKGSTRCTDCNKHLVPAFVFCPYCGSRASRNGSRTQFIKAPASLTGTTEKDLP